MSLLQKNALVSGYKSRRTVATRILSYAPLETPVGCLFAAYDGEVLCLISAQEEAMFLDKARQILKMLPVREPVLPARLAQWILDAIQGQTPDLIPMDLSSLTFFQRKVLEQILEIPRGEVRSYAWVAREIGHPRANRAVGTALARNPLPFIIPCHRVVCSDGQLGAYSGGVGTLKERLLAHEGVDLPYLYDLKHRRLYYRGDRNTNIFCLPTCYLCKQAKEQNIIYFRSIQEAIATGYRSCKVCRPIPQLSEEG